MKSGRRCNYHKGRQAIRHYANLREPSLQALVDIPTCHLVTGRGRHQHQQSGHETDIPSKQTTHKPGDCDWWLVLLSSPNNSSSPSASALCSSMFPAICKICLSVSNSSFVQFRTTLHTLPALPREQHICTRIIGSGIRYKLGIWRE